MISAISLLGKVAEFLAHQLGAKELARGSDKRGQACQMITRLYYLLVDLRSVTDYMIEGADLSIEHSSPSILASRFRDISGRVEKASNEFFETLGFLDEPLALFAPETADALAAITAWKGNLLWEISRAFIIERSPDGFHEILKVRYLRPKDRILEIDFGAYVERVRTGQVKVKPEQLEWPDDFLYGGSVTSAFEESEVSFASIEDVKQFSSLLRKHSKVLDSGISALKSFIQSKFTFDEVLYENKKIEPAFFP